MENKILIPIAVFCLSILIAQSFIVKPAHAQVFNVISALAYNIKGMHYQPETDSIWVITSNSSPTKNILYQIDRSTQSVIGTFNHTTNFGSAYIAMDIWCGKTDCFITAGSGGVPAKLFKISTEDIAPNIFAGQNVTGTYTHTVTTTGTIGFDKLTGRDQVSGGFGSISIWIGACVQAGCTTRQPIIVDGISMTLAGTLTSEMSGSDTTTHDLEWSGISGTIDNDLVVVSGGLANASQSELIIYDLATLILKCQTTIPTNNLALDVATNYFEADSINNKIYVSANNGVVYIYNDNCSLQDTITGSETGLLGTGIRYIEYDAGRVFMQGTGANAVISQMLTNSTGHIIDTDNNTYFPLPSVSQNAFDSVFTQIKIAEMILLAGNGALWFPYTGTDRRVGILIYDEDLQGGGGGELSEFCQQPENVNILRCVLERGDTTPLVGASETIGNSTNTIVCQLGLIECTNFVPNNPDTKTNGVGYLILFVGLGIMIGIFWVASRGDLGSIPTFLWFIATLSIVGVMVAFNLIDATILIVAIIAIVALATAKAKGIFGSSGLFAGDT